MVEGEEREAEPCKVRASAAAAAAACCAKPALLLLLALRAAALAWAAVPGTREAAIMARHSLEMRESALEPRPPKGLKTFTATLSSGAAEEEEEEEGGARPLREDEERLLLLPFPGPCTSAGPPPPLTAPE